MNGIEAKVIDNIQRTHNVRSVRVELKEPAGFQAGQYMYVTIDNDITLSRYLSISNSPTETGFLEFTKKITDSDFSKRVISLEPGELIHIKYPLGSFVYDESFSKIAFLSGGIGITPIRSICKYLIDSKKDVDVVLLYGNRSSGDIVFREDFTGLSKNSAALKVVHILEDTEDEKFKRGRIDSQLVKELIPDYLERKFYICGPPAMVSAMHGMLQEELVVSEQNVITENFEG
ncbi:MAG: FAD-dependent oxidoreductase, partial [Candidatus Omnitrophota bacterium]